MSPLALTFFAILFVALFPVTGAQQDSSDSLVENDSSSSPIPPSVSGIQQCEKYREIENQVHCGESGYPLGYGYRYCRRFYEKLDEFTESGKKFVECAAKCLTDRLGEYIDQAQNVSCSNIHDYAYDTHPDCYVQCGFCSVITKSANIKAFFDVIELKDLALRTVLQTGAKCAGVYWDNIKATVLKRSLSGKAAEDIAVTKEDLIEIADRVEVLVCILFTLLSFINGDAPSQFATYLANRHIFVDSFSAQDQKIHGISIYNNYVAVALNHSVILYYVETRWKDGQLLFRKKSTWFFGGNFALNDSVPLLDFRLVDETSQFLCTSTICRVCNIAVDDHTSGCSNSAEYQLSFDGRIITDVRGTLVGGRVLFIHAFANTSERIIQIYGQRTPKVKHLGESLQNISSLKDHSFALVFKSQKYVYFVSTVIGTASAKIGSSNVILIRLNNDDQSGQLDSMMDLSILCGAIDYKKDNTSLEALAGVVDYSGQSFLVAIRNGTGPLANTVICEYLISEIDDALMIQKESHQIGVSKGGYLFAKWSATTELKSMQPGFSSGVTFLQMADGTLQVVKQSSESEARLRTILYANSSNAIFGYCDYYNSIFFASPNGKDLFYMTISWEQKMCTEKGGSCRPTDHCHPEAESIKFLCNLQPDIVHCCIPRQEMSCQRIGGVCTFRHACGANSSVDGLFRSENMSGSCSPQPIEDVGCCKATNIESASDKTNYTASMVWIITLFAVLLIFVLVVSGLLLYWKNRMTNRMHLNTQLEALSGGAIRHLEEDTTFEMMLDRVPNPPECVMRSETDSCSVADVHSNALFPAALSSGAQITDVRFIGRGSFGTVYSVRCKDDWLAVKQIKREDNDCRRLKIYLKVIRKSGGCPYIVSYYGYKVTEEHFTICMEMMDTCLGKLLRRVPSGFSESICATVAFSVLTALTYLQRHKIMHRDIKASNILINCEGAIKLCDFGIADRLVSSVRTGQAGCTPYMAPERIKSNRAGRVSYDYKADVWSLGITLIELATGSCPYKGKEFEIEAAILRGTPPQLSHFTHANSFHDLQNFVNECTVNDAQIRPSSQKLLVILTFCSLIVAKFIS
ncbi:protein kinase domain-containing protein [Ditylenchus destructor]|nr:protein kinase domain-containing protein [Ditylenchus destructor]